jgi:hypothetical protein
MASAPKLVRDSSLVTRSSPTRRASEPDVSLPAPGSVLPADYESGLVDIFADLAELFGNPKSYGQIYGLLFASEAPMSMEEIAQRLEISQGSTSQGLRQLEAFGAVIKERNNGSRQALYTAKLEMKLLISGFLKERVIPRLESTESRIKAKWHRSARTILPIARKILGGG